MKFKNFLIPVLGIVVGKGLVAYAIYRETYVPEPDANIGVGIVHLLGLSIMWIAIIALPIMLLFWLLNKKN